MNWTLHETLAPVVVNKNGTGWRYKLLRLKSFFRKLFTWKL